ncbi:two-component system response regulator [Radicibacter daui]|uniref:two-component system response regulator n=1 Tax=Radicibacter daui TaxID=3064829 RepID=UPI004046BEC1
MSNRILIVEDEGIVALHLKRQLEKLGYTVADIAASGSAALEKIGKTDPELVLMDIHIDGPMDGIETASRISDRPVIYLTAFSEEATLNRARETSPFGYLLKPFSERELHATIQMALERHRVDLALRASQERLNLAMNAAGMGLWEVDIATRALMLSHEAGQVFGPEYKAQPRSLDELSSVLDPRDWPAVEAAFTRLAAEGGQMELEFRTAAAYGGRWLKAQGRTFEPASGMGDRKRIVGVVRDITERRCTEHKLRQAATVFGVMQDGIAILDLDFTVTTVNENCSVITGYRAADLTERPFFKLPTSRNLPEYEVRAALKQDGHWRAEVETRRKNGEPMRTIVHIAAVTDSAGALTHYVAVLSDMTSVRRVEAELAHLAHYDSLTGLPNRLLAMDRLEQSLRRARREKARMGVLFVDLDRFKAINDTLGHAAGDELLALAAHRMKGAVRKSDTVARLGGDEFMIILDEIHEPVDAAQVAQKLLEALSPAFMLSGHEAFISASIGISLYPGNGGDAETLISAADTAMYSAKQAGRNRYAFFTGEMTASTLVSIRQEHELRQALREGEFRLHYQPQLCMKTGTVNGLEALLRWQHPERGLLGAGDIIPAAERLGLIADIGDWVIGEACRQIALWKAEGLGDIRVAVNVSAAQLRDGRVVDCVRAALTATGIRASLLEVEVTESLLQDEETCSSTLTALAALGTTIALDDFGTGYSCLKSLLDLPIHRVKIDRSFTSGLPSNPKVCAVVGTIITMSHQLGMYVLAEGVETQEQETFLRANGCEESQGFLYARPMPPPEAAAYVTAASKSRKSARRRTLTPSAAGKARPRQKV